MKHLKLFGIICIVLFIVSFIVPTICVVRNIKFTQQCGGYLKQAADANTVELAASRLDKAIEYIEANNLTDGYTSVLWKTEDDNVGFWYENIIACRDELRVISEKEDASQLEKSNILMKVRESLLDNKGENGDKITVPKGISRYPYNALFGWLRFLSYLLMVVSFCGFLVIIDE